MIYKILGTLIILAAGTIAFLTVQQEDLSFLMGKKSEPAAPCVQLTPAKQLIKLIEDDFAGLAKSKELPSEWNSIAQAKILMNSQLAKTLLGKELPHINQVKEGTAELEFEVMDLPDEENPGIIIQASLFDIKSKNKIYEIGRTYTMNDLNKVVPEKESSKQDSAKQNNGSVPAENSQPSAPAAQAVPAATPVQQQKAAE